MKSKGIDKDSLVRVVLVVLGLSLGSQAGLALDRWEELTQAGLKLRQQGRMTEAEENLREALSEAERLGGQECFALGLKAFHSLGALRQGNYPEAESFYKKAIATLQKQPEFDQRDLAGMFNNLVLCKNSMPLKSLEEEALLSDNLQQCTRFFTNSPFSSSPWRAGSTNINSMSSST